MLEDLAFARDALLAHADYDSLESLLRYNSRARIQSEIQHQERRYTTVIDQGF